MLTSYSRVTVVSGTRRVDLALPSALPVADVVPQVLRFCAPEESPDGEPTEFTLAQVGGQSLSLSQSLGRGGRARRGRDRAAVLHRAEGRAAFIEDVRDAIEDSVDGAGGAWTSQSTVTFTVITTCGVLLLLLVDRCSACGSGDAGRSGVRLDRAPLVEGQRSGERRRDRGDPARRDLDRHPVGRALDAVHLLDRRGALGVRRAAPS